MMSTTTNRSWFAIYVKPRHEKVISSALRSKGYEELTPTYKRLRSGRSEVPLFPGYVFCRFDNRDRVPILSVPGVFFIVGSGKTPVPVPDQEIENLRKVACSGLEAEPWPYVEVGQRVQIQEGPLRGVEGCVVSVQDSDRLVVSIGLLRRSVAVLMNRSWVMSEEARTRRVHAGTRVDAQ